MKKKAVEPIKPDEVLYIKLGRGGEFEKECIEGGILRLGFREATHQACLSAQWEQVQQQLEAVPKSRGVATRAKNQIRAFYESDESVLWVTFHKNALHWCFSHPQLTLREDKYKTRPAVDGWKSTDINGKQLLMSEMSGALLAMQGFQGTICKVREKDYLLSKINGVQLPEISQAEAALSELEARIAPLIRRLTWQDFEVLIDFIFRAAGWQRLGDLGKTKKTLDMEMLMPITNERCGVQVKATCSLAKFKRYRDDKLRGMQGFERFYFVVHSPDSNLTSESAAVLETENRPEDAPEPEVTLMLSQEIAHLTVRYGLARWVIDKAR